MTAQLDVPARRLTGTADRQRLAMTGFFGIMELWGASNAAMRRILGAPPERTFYDGSRAA